MPPPPPKKRKIGVHGMKDLKKTAQKPATGNFGMSNSNRVAQSGGKPRIYGMKDLEDKTDAKADPRPRRLQDIVATGILDNDGLLDKLHADYSIGNPDADVLESDEGDADDDVTDEGEADGYEDYVSEAEEAASDEEQSGSSVDEEEVIRKAQPKVLSNRARNLHNHMERAARVEADNQYIADYTDEQLDNLVAPADDGGYFELVPVGPNEQVPKREIVNLNKFKQIKPGEFYDPATKLVYCSTNYVDPKTGKILRTVRRHRNGPPQHPTFEATKVSAEQLKAMAEEDDCEDRP